MILDLFKRRRPLTFFAASSPASPPAFAATLIMDQFQKLIYGRPKGRRKADASRPTRIPRSDRTRSAATAATEPRRQEDSTEIVARKIAEAAGKELRHRREEESRAGRPLHLRHSHGHSLRSRRRTSPRSHHRRRHCLRHACSSSAPTKSPSLPSNYPLRPRDTRAPTTSSTGPPTSSTVARSNSSAASCAASCKPSSGRIAPSERLR